MNNESISHGNFTFHKTSIKDLMIIEAKIYGDHRGYFMESYHKKTFYEGGIIADFVQDNQSLSSKGVLRGLHFQRHKPQGKLVRVLKGSVYDVAVDLRKNASTYGEWEGVLLSEENKRMLYVPEGFAHGFLVISEMAEFIYKCTNFYEPDYEDGIIYDDATLKIKWPLHLVDKILLSEKDSLLGTFDQYHQQK